MPTSMDITDARVPNELIVERIFRPFALRMRLACAIRIYVCISRKRYRSPLHHVMTHTERSPNQPLLGKEKSRDRS
jgi:hypothetical protein